MERKKMELQVNQPTKIKLLFDDCVEGSSQYGKYFLYAVQNGDGNSEYSLFAPDQLHEQLKKFKKNDELIVTKIAAQRGTKLIVAYEVQKQNIPSTAEDSTSIANTEDDFFYTAMEKSFEQALRIQSKFNGMANVNQIAITLFIQMCSGKHSYARG